MEQGKIIVAVSVSDYIISNQKAKNKYLFKTLDAIEAIMDDIEQYSLIRKVVLDNMNDYWRKNEQLVLGTIESENGGTYIQSTEVVAEVRDNSESSS